MQRVAGAESATRRCFVRAAAAARRLSLGVDKVVLVPGCVRSPSAVVRQSVDAG